MTCVNAIAPNKHRPAHGPRSDTSLLLDGRAAPVRESVSSIGAAQPQPI
jgi:hypothetical protein